MSYTDICRILNEKENEGIEKQKADTEAIQHITKTKKSIRTRDETLKNKECTKKCKGHKEPKYWIAWKTRKPSIEAGIRRNAICYNTLNEI